MFVASDFLRARQTAEECRAALQNIVSFERQAAAGENGDGGGATPSEGVGNQVEWLGDGESGGYDVCPPVVIRQELRERFFGELDGTILVNYNKVREEVACRSQRFWFVLFIFCTRASVTGYGRRFSEGDELSRIGHARSILTAKMRRFKCGCLPPQLYVSFLSCQAKSATSNC